MNTNQMTEKPHNSAWRKGALAAEAGLTTAVRRGRRRRESEAAKSSATRLLIWLMILADVRLMNLASTFPTIKSTEPFYSQGSLVVVVKRQAKPTRR